MSAPALVDTMEQVENSLLPPRAENNGQPVPMPLAERMAHYHVPGVSVAVVAGAQLEWARGYGTLRAGHDAPVEPDSLFHAASLSKLVAAVTALRLVAEGTLELDHNVNHWLKRWQVPVNDLTRANPVTLRRLLAHQSGIVDPEGSFEPLREGEAFPRMVDVLAGRTRLHPGPVHVTVEAECDFYYSDAGYCVIEQLITDATGQRFDAVVAERVFEPLGMARSRYQHDAALGGEANAACGHNPDGTPLPGCRAVYPYPAAAGLWTTPTDLALLLIALIGSLEGESDSLLPHPLAWDMITAQGCTDWMGLGVFVEGERRAVSIFSQGWGAGSQCQLVAYPLLGMGAVVMTNSNPGQPQHRALTGEIMRGIGHVYGWPGYG